MTSAEDWVEGVVQGLHSTGEIMRPVYVSFMGEDEDPEPCFGRGWARLKTLKQSYDAEDRFCNAQPKLPVA